MTDKHANMPGMNEPAKKPEQAPKPEKNKSADSGAPGHQHKSG